MITCSTLEKIRTDLENLVNSTSSIIENEYILGEHQIKVTVKAIDKDEYLLQVEGPIGLQEANQESLKKVTSVATLFLSRQLGIVLKAEELSPCENEFHDADEILEVFKALKEFSVKSELPFSYYIGNENNKRELFSIKVSDSRFKVYLETHRIHGKVMKHVTEVEEYDKLTEKAEQLTAFEMIAWMTPKGMRSKKKSFVFARLSSWLVPALVSGLIVAGVMGTAWINFNSSKDWKSIEIKAQKAIENGKEEEGIKLYHQAIIKAEREGVSDDKRLQMQQKLVDFVRYYSSYDNYLRESAKLIMVAQVLKDDRLVEDTMFIVAEEEFVREHYKKALAEINSLIPIVARSRGEDFDGLVRAYEILGRSYYKLKQWEPAQKALSKSIELSKNVKGLKFKSSAGVANYYLGVMAERENKLEAAAKYFKQADELQKKVLDRTEYRPTDKRFFELQPSDDLKRVEAKLKKSSNPK